MMQRDSLGIRDQRRIALQPLAQPRDELFVPLDQIEPIPWSQRLHDVSRHRPGPRPHLENPSFAGAIRSTPLRGQNARVPCESRGATRHHCPCALKRPAKFPQKYSIIGPLLLHRPILGPSPRHQQLSPAWLLAGSD